jgi:rSAM/selenodomain-associated transferase 1
MIDDEKKPDRLPDERLIIFTRYPEPGRTKTRLIPALGPEGAAEFHRRLTGQTLETGRQIESKRRIQLEIYYDGGDESQMQAWLGGQLTFRPQGSGDLGEKLHRAFHETFQTGARRVVIIGTDSPDLTAEILEEAFDAVLSCDLVIGPANDGGYYLIGLGRMIPELFAGIEWGGEKVFAQTVSKAREVGARFELLVQLSDVDRPEDLEACQTRLPLE